MPRIRKTRGRQKIEIKKMTNKNNLQVTFSKRRNGLFKKASELSTLCGADVVLVVFSPGGKVFSFGHPNVETVINRYLTQVPLQNDNIAQLIEAHRNANVRELSANLTLITDQFEVDKKHGEQLIHACKAMENQFWWACSVEDMDTPKLTVLKEALEVIKKDAARHANMHIIHGASPIPPYFIYGGASSSSNIHLHQQPPPSAQIIPQPGFFQNPMLQSHLYDGMMHHQGHNNIGGYGYY